MQKIVKKIVSDNYKEFSKPGEDYCIFIIIFQFYSIK